MLWQFAMRQPDATLPGDEKVMLSLVDTGKRKTHQLIGIILRIKAILKS
jgi:hypothetical protein